MGKRFVATPEMVAEATRLYVEEELTLQAVGDLYGVSATTVSRNLLVGVPRRRPGMRAGTMLKTYAEKAEQKRCPVCQVLTDDGEKCDQCAGRMVEERMAVASRVVEPLAGIVWAGTFLTMHNPAYLEVGNGW